MAFLFSHVGKKLVGHVVLLQEGNHLFLKTARALMFALRLDSCNRAACCEPVPEGPLTIARRFQRRVRAQEASRVPSGRLNLRYKMHPA